MRHHLSVVALLVGPFVVAVPTAATAAATDCDGSPTSIVGTTGDDELVGTDGPDVIDGLGGDDTIHGLGGDDILCGGDGSDLLDGGAGDDSLQGGRDGRYLYDESDDDYYFVGDRLVPGAGDDVVDAGVDDRIEQYYDVRQPDWLDYAAAPAAVTVDLAAGTVEGDGHDQLLAGTTDVVGSAFDDVMTGGDTDDRLVGGPGADHLEGAGGNDYLSDEIRGYDGTDPSDDVLVGGDGGDTLVSGAGEDDLDGGPGDDGLTDRDDDADVLHGGEGADVLRSGSSYPHKVGGLDQVYGDGGDDYLDVLIVPGTGLVADGGGGKNRIQLSTYFARNGTEQHPAGTTDLEDGTTTVDWPTPTTATVRNAAILAVPSRWTVWGTDGPEEITAFPSEGPITVHARGGDDRLIGSDDVDLLEGGTGTDFAKSGEGDDTCIDVETTDIAGNTCDEAGVVGPADRLAGGAAPSLSADGRYVVFDTEEALVAKDTDDKTDVYLRDRETGRTSLVSVNMPRGGADPDVSGDGSLVVFQSGGRIYLRDRSSGRTTLMSVTNRGKPANEWAGYPTISDDGRRVAFLSSARNLPGESDQVYVRDRARKRTVLVSRRQDGRPATSVDSIAPEISGDGRFILFTSYDEEMTPAGVEGLFVRRLDTGQVTWVDNPRQDDDGGSISRTGRYVGFTRVDPDCPGEDADCHVVMVRDLKSPHRLWTASVTADGQRGDGSSYYPVLSGDGRFVLFTSFASDLVEGDDNGTSDVFVRDLRTGITTLVSTDADGSPAEGSSGSIPGPFGHGPAVAFAGDASALAFEGSRSGERDLFVRSWATTRRK